jgi:hypothetical protein
VVPFWPKVFTLAKPSTVFAAMAAVGAAVSLPTPTPLRTMVGTLAGLSRV